MRILLSGLNGHMGQEVVKIAENYNATITCGVDSLNQSGNIPCVASFKDANTDVDLIVDFSHHSLTKDLVDFAVNNKLPLVLATTGQTDEEKEYIKNAANKIPLFFAANYSLGVALLIELAKKTAATMKDAEIEIVETHHDRKLDVPSGTALAIANAIKSVLPKSTFNIGRPNNGKRTKEEIGIHSLRIGNVVGIHEVIVATPSQTITLKHEAHSRSLFAEGALSAANFLLGKEPGLYDMQSMLNL